MKKYPSLMSLVPNNEYQMKIAAKTIEGKGAKRSSSSSSSSSRRRREEEERGGGNSRAKDMGRKERKKEEKVCALWLPLPPTGNGVAAIMQIVATGKGTFGGDSVCN